jgi:hypothetical protein
MVDCFNRHDPEALAACYAPDARIHPAGWPQAVDTGTWLAAVPVIFTTFPDLRLHPRNLAADDRVALLEARMTGTNTGPFPLSESSDEIMEAGRRLSGVLYSLWVCLVQPIPTPTSGRRGSTRRAGGPGCRPLAG